MEPKINKTFTGDTAYEFQGVITFWVGPEGTHVASVRSLPCSSVQELEDHMVKLQQAITYIKQVG